MIVKVRVGDKYEYLEIPEFLKEDYYNDIERHLTEGEVPISGRVLRWGRSKRVVLQASSKINIDMKNKIWQTIKTKRFLYALLTAVLLCGFAVGSAQFWQWLIPWRLVEILIWAAIYFTLLGYTLLHWEDWYDKHCS